MPEPQLRAVLLFGPPGVGKGTQGLRLGRLPHFHHVSTGDLFRSLDPQSPLGVEVRGFTEKGVLVPDELTIRIFCDFLDRMVRSKEIDPVQDTVVLDGIPRNVHQSQMLNGAVRVMRLIQLVSSDDDALVSRIRGRAQLEGRKDDLDESVIRRRFEVYRRETRPVLEYYPANLLVEIDALQTPDQVAATIQKALGQ
jgi:adenylate kinase